MCKNVTERNANTVVKNVKFNKQPSLAVICQLFTLNKASTLVRERFHILFNSGIEQRFSLLTSPLRIPF